MKRTMFEVRQLHRAGVWYVRVNMRGAYPHPWVTDDFGNLTRAGHLEINHYLRQEH